MLVAGGFGVAGLLASAELYSPPPVASVPSRVRTVRAKLKFAFACEGVTGQICHGRATVTAIEKLSVNGTITGVLSTRTRTGRYRIVTILKGQISAAAGQDRHISIGLDSTGRVLRATYGKSPRA